jgi:chromosome segregation ATPase
MNDYLTILGVLLAGALPVSGILLGKRFSGEDSNESIALLREESRILENKIIEALAGDSLMASKAQLHALSRKTKEFQSALESQRQIRIELEEKLKTIHADVITRESAHQQMKSAKHEDEVALQSVVSNYHDISSESVSLERRLAESLKTIDKMTSEVALTEDQKAVFEALSNALTSGSTQLRDVIVAHQNVYERLEALRAQYTDLEGEYIKLVELQLEA